MSRRSISIRLQLDDADAAAASLANFLEAFTPAQRGRLLQPAIESHVRSLVAGLTGGSNAAALTGDQQAVAPVQLQPAKRRTAAQRQPAVQDSAQGDIRPQPSVDKNAAVTPQFTPPPEPLQSQATPAAEPEPAQPSSAQSVQAETSAVTSSVPPANQPKPAGDGKRTGLRALLKQAETL